MGQHSRGQGLFEYGLILLFVALVALVAITLFGSALSAFFNSLHGLF